MKLTPYEDDEIVNIQNENHEIESLKFDHNLNNVNFANSFVKEAMSGASSDNLRPRTVCSTQFPFITPLVSSNNLADLVEKKNNNNVGPIDKNI